ncbi:MAG: hypothetical protein HC937_03750, partial [Aquincola sp.]|nr:hypothetical protein [Aquincola sp.]
IERHGGSAKKTTIVRVPGAWETPLVVRKIALARKDDPLFAIIALGAVIRGSTPHFDYVAGEVAKGVASVDPPRGGAGSPTCD